MTPIEVKEYFVTWRNAMRKAGLSENAYGAWLRNGYILCAHRLSLRTLVVVHLKQSTGRM